MLFLLLDDLVEYPPPYLPRPPSLLLSLTSSPTALDLRGSYKVYNSGTFVKFWGTSVQIQLFPSATAHTNTLLAPLLLPSGLENPIPLSSSFPDYPRTKAHIAVRPEESMPNYGSGIYSPNSFKLNPKLLQLGVMGNLLSTASFPKNVSPPPIIEISYLVRNQSSLRTLPCPFALFTCLATKTKTHGTRLSSSPHST